jgi:hypothetical protein
MDPTPAPLHSNVHIPISFLRVSCTSNMHVPISSLRVSCTSNVHVPISFLRVSCTSNIHVPISSLRVSCTSNIHVPISFLSDLHHHLLPFTLSVDSSINHRLCHSPTHHLLPFTLSMSSQHRRTTCLREFARLLSNSPNGAGPVRVFDRKFTLEDAIICTPLLHLKRCHACDQWHSSRSPLSAHFLTGSHCKLRRSTNGRSLMSRVPSTDHELCHHTDDVTQN